MRVSCHVWSAVGCRPTVAALQSSSLFFQAHYGVSCYGRGGGFDEPVLPFPPDYQRLKLCQILQSRNLPPTPPPSVLSETRRWWGGKKGETRIRDWLWSQNLTLIEKVIKCVSGLQLCISKHKCLFSLMSQMPHLSCWFAVNKTLQLHHSQEYFQWNYFHNVCRMLRCWFAHATHNCRLSVWDVFSHTRHTLLRWGVVSAQSKLYFYSVKYSSLIIPTCFSWS